MLAINHGISENRIRLPQVFLQLGHLLDEIPNQPIKACHVLRHISFPCGGRVRTGLSMWFMGFTEERHTFTIHHLGRGLRTIQITGIVCCQWTAGTRFHNPGSRQIPMRSKFLFQELFGWGGLAALQPCSSRPPPGFTMPGHTNSEALSKGQLVHPDSPHCLRVPGGAW